MYGSWLLPFLGINPITRLNQKMFSLESGIELDSNFQKCHLRACTGEERGASSMRVIVGDLLLDLLLFSCTAAFVTWLVIEVAGLLS